MPGRALTEALLLIAAAPDQATMMQVLTEQARAIIGAHQSVTSLTVSDDWAQAITAISISDKYAAWRTYDELPDGSGIYNVVCKTNRTMRMTQRQLERHRAWRGFGASVDRHPPMRGWLAVPLVAADGRNLGLVQLSDKYEGDFTAKDESTLVQLARLASIAIEKAAAEAALQAALRTARHQEQQLHQVAQQLVTAREDERKRLGFDLHDNVCQELIGIAIMVSAVRQRLRPDEAERFSELDRVGEYLNALVEHLRQLAGDLRPMQLRDLGLEAGLRSLAEGLSATGSRISIVSPSSVPRLGDATEVAVYRVAQEALLNAVRHARASAITLTLSVVDDRVCLEVRDDGCGFENENQSLWGVGIASMRERALALGGQCDVSTTPGAGTVVRLFCPVHPQRE